MPYNISEDKRDWYRRVSARSRRRKEAAKRGELAGAEASPNRPGLMPESLMPQRRHAGLRCLSLFSGGGGLDLGFERAGLENLACFDILDICGATLKRSRPNWEVHSGPRGDATAIRWAKYAGAVDVLHGGPPCQPFSVAGRQQGGADRRDMWPAFIRAVRELAPAAFVAENVPGLLGRRFQDYVRRTILAPLSDAYQITAFQAFASHFGVPQDRQRVFFVGFRSAAAARRYVAPTGTHRALEDFFLSRQPTLGARAALGLPDIGFDRFAPTLRSGFTGPRKTTSILNSKASQSVWRKLRIWPNGVQATREDAARFPPENGHFRLSVQDCALLQGFPESWCFQGAVYQALGQIGNSVCPPVAYAVACAVVDALSA